MAKTKIPTAYDQRPDATGPIIITLPLMPISANALFKNVGKRRARTKEYDGWLAQMSLLVRNQCKVRMPHRANVSILVEEKSERRDIDNAGKCCLDLLVKLGILADDSSKYVRSVSATWSGEIEGLNIQVWPAVAGVV